MAGEIHWDYGESERARQAFKEALETAKESRENVYVEISALSSMGNIAVMRGKLNEAEDFFQRAIQCGTSASGAALPVPAVGLVHGGLVLLHYQRNEIERAQHHLDVVLQATEQMSDPQATVRAYLYQALLDQSRGEFNSAESWLQRAEQVMQAHPVRDLIQTEWIVLRGQFHLAQGDLTAVLSLLSDQEVRPADLDVPPAPGSERARLLGTRLGRYLLLARTLLAQGAPDRAEELLVKVGIIAENHPDVTVFLEALVLRAGTAYRRQGDGARALAYLECALDLAAPEGHVRPFLNAGTLLVKPLRQAVMQGIHPAYAQKLLAALSDQERRQTGVQCVATSPEGVDPGLAELVEPLTEREQQVLRLLAAGLSSTEVAEELVIAVSTSRSYIKSLYGKLDAHSRDEAIAKGQQYGLI